MKTQGQVDFPFSSLNRRSILRTSAIGIIIYSAIVLNYSNLVPDLGIRIFGGSVRGVSEKAVLGSTPRAGDKVLSIAGIGINSLPRYVNTIGNLRNDAKLHPVPITRLEELSEITGDAAKLGDTRFVRLRFQSESDDEKRSAAVAEGWYQVRDLPWQTSVISMAWFAMEALLFWMGWLIFRRRPEDDGAALFFLMCIVTVGAYMGGYHWLQIAGSPALTFIFAVCAMAVPQVSLHFFLVYPKPKRIVRRFPKLALALMYVGPAVLQIAILWTIGTIVSLFRHDFPVESIQVHVERLWWLIWIYLVVGAAMFVGCLVCLMHSYWSARQGIQRTQVSWILGGALFAGLFVAYSLWLAIRAPEDFALGGATWSMFVASLIFTAAYAVSIARYRMLYVDEILEKGVLYLLISFAGGLCYYMLLIVAFWYSPRLAADTSHGQALLISTFIILALLTLSTVRTRVQKLLDRRFFREKHQLDRTIRRLDIAVGKLVDRETVTKRSLLLIGDLLNARDAAIYLRRSDERADRPGKEGVLVPENGHVLEYEIVQQSGDRDFPDRFATDHALVRSLEGAVLLQSNPGPVLPGDSHSPVLRPLGVELAQPFLLDGDLFGFLLVGPKETGSYTPEELEFLTGIGDLVAMALHSAETQQTLERLNEDLRAKVERVSRQKQQILALQPPTPTAAEPGETSMDLEAIRGRSAATLAMVESIRKIAASSSTVLLRGESGTGKSLLAEVIHRNSNRSSGPFVTVHCATLSPGVLESELFGHVKGAYTGAIKDKIGRFQLANKGTLFLDEIGDISLDIQTKLLRVLQEMTFEPVGSNESVTVDVRVIAATHQPLEELIRRGKWREDLFYRLNVISIRTPSLRERREDIGELALHFLSKYARRGGKRVEGIDEDAFELLVHHDWPGNIRELENVMERAVVMADSVLITPADLPAELMETSSELPGVLERMQVPTTSRAGVAPRLAPLTSELDALERQRLLDALSARGGNKSKAAELLGIPRSTFCSKLRKFGIA